MPARKPPSESVLARAAEARAEGNCWKVVGQVVHRSPNTVRKWQYAYPERWATAMRTADRRVIGDAAAEAVCVLRQLIRSDDDKVRQTAAWHLVYQRLELSKLKIKAAAHADPPPPSDAQLIANFVEAHTHDQLIQLATSLLNAQVPKRIQVSGDEAAGGG